MREAVLNALIHRDYSIYTEGTPIQIDFFSDRLEIHSPGSLYGRMSVEDLGGCAPGRTQSGACSDDREPDRCRAPRTRKEVAEFLGIGTVYHANKRYIQPLVEQGRLKLGIPDKPSSRKQTFTTVQEQGEVL